MKRIITLLLFCGTIQAICAQTSITAPSTEPFGKINQADLELKKCDFEPDANAEVLFDKGTVYYTTDEIVLERHVRIKIFNDNGKWAANIRLPYYSADHFEWIEKLQAETINDNNGHAEITKVDKKDIFTKHVDKLTSEITFTFPNVTSGSILEYKYNIESNYVSDFPDWYFQSELPTRYSELNANVPNYCHYKNLVRVNQPYIANERDNNGEIVKMALGNVPSIASESYMSSVKDNLQCILTQLLSITPGVATLDQSFSETWNKVGEDEAGYDDFGGQFRRKLAGEDELIEHAKALKTTDEKIAYIFDEVKNRMKWNGQYQRYTDDGTAAAWDKKVGNSTEINLIVYHLLTKANVKALPVLLSTRKNGKVNPAYATRFQFNTCAVYVPVDSLTNYVIDATGKYNLYNVTPFNLLNSYGLLIDKENKKYDLLFIQNTMPVKDVVFLNANIKPEGKMDGSAQISDMSYNRISNLDSYNTDGEKKYIENLKQGNNDLDISSLKMENVETDSLPLLRNINFSLNLTGSDGTYIYFKPNLFTQIGNNPFLSEKRTTNIDFGYLNNLNIIGNYKIPAGYKADALPKSVKMDMPDQSISFRRFVMEDGGTVTVRYNIVYKKSVFFKENYAEIHDFYKKMYEFMDEQVVLKKI